MGSPCSRAASLLVLLMLLSLSRAIASQALPSNFSLLPSLTHSRFGRTRSLAVVTPSKKKAVCDYRKGSWVHVSRIPGYRVPYPSDCSPNFSCKVPPTRTQPAYNFVWVPAPPCNYVNWKFNAHRFLRKQRNTVIAFVGDSLNDNLFEGVVCMLKAQTRIVNKKMRFGPRSLGVVHAPNYNFTMLTVNSGYLVQSPRYIKDHKRATYSMNPKWESLLPYTDAIVFSAGHWFFHAPKDNSTKWQPMVVMSKALVALRDYFNRSPYKGTPIFVTFSPVHERGYCNYQAPFTNSFNAEKMLMSFNMPAAKKQITVLKRSRIRVAEVTYMSLLRADAHLGLNGKDCSHWCLPGVPDNWADVIYNILMGVRRNFKAGR